MPIKVSSLALLLAGSCCLAGCSPPAEECQRFRTGNFTYHFRGPQGSFSFLVTRRGNLQTETNQQDGTTSRFRVNWLDACTYELHLLESTAHFPHELEEMRRKSPLKTEITGTTGRYYLFRSQRAGSNFVLSDTIWVQP